MAEHSAKRRKIRKGDDRDEQRAPEITDPRFTSIQSDPRYRLPSKRDHQVRLDTRFSGILKDEDFSRKSKVDRYGRALDAKSEQKRLKRRFGFEDEDVDEDDEVQEELQRAEKKFDPLRDGRDSASSSEESSSDEDEDLDEAALTLADQENDIPTGEVTSRVAVVNLDWDNIRAVDLMAVCSSFLPATGRLLKVSVYPSDFGKERMEREEMEGPPKEIFNTMQAESEDEEEIPYAEEEQEIKEAIVKPDEGNEFDSAKLRQYQLERLRYYFAILDFSSHNAAKVVYDVADGAEYLSTANFFDLRFVPDGTDFSNDEPRDECEKIPEGYKPNEFITDALQHSKVKLTWDAEDITRKEAQARAFRGSRKDIDENDLKAYLGTDSSENEDVEEEQEQASSKKEQERQKMRALLGLGAEPVKISKKDDSKPVGDLQVTFSAGLSSDNKKRTSVFENEPEIEETTVDRYVRKERERKQQRKQKFRGNTKIDADADANALDSEIKAVEAATKEPDPDLGFNDPFFAEPSNDKAAASKLRKEERLKRRSERAAEEAASATQRAELELLMVDDREAEVRHFDMKEIERAEKWARKKGKKNGKRAKQVVSAVDSFKMDTQDPRFARLFENHEFAIDPSDPKFKGTQGMRELLDEGRKRRKGKRGEDGEADGRSEQSHGRPVTGDIDVRRLVEKAKKQKK